MLSVSAPFGPVHTFISWSKQTIYQFIMTFSAKSTATICCRKAGENRRISRRSKCCIRCLSIHQRTVVVYIRFLRIGQSIVCIAGSSDGRSAIDCNGTDSIDEILYIFNGHQVRICSLSIKQRAIVGH